jgi:hypothetical protein
VLGRDWCLRSLTSSGPRSLKRRAMRPIQYAEYPVMLAMTVAVRPRANNQRKCHRLRSTGSLVLR